MTTHSIPLFPTLVQVVEGFLTPDQCADIVSFLRNKKHTMTEHKALAGDAVTSHVSSRAVMELDEIASSIRTCSHVKDKIQHAVSEYSKEAGFPNNTLINSWTNFQGRESMLKEHVHGMSYISGAVFLQTDDQSSKLFFHNPNPHVGSIDKKNSEKPYMWDWFFVEPVIGNLVLFPSWLKHGSNHTQNNSEERVVLSFNTL